MSVSGPTGAALPGGTGDNNFTTFMNLQQNLEDLAGNYNAGGIQSALSDATALSSEPKGQGKMIGDFFKNALTALQDTNPGPSMGGIMASALYKSTVSIGPGSNAGKIIGEFVKGLGQIFHGLNNQGYEMPVFKSFMSALNSNVMNGQDSDISSALQAANQGFPDGNPPASGLEELINSYTPGQDMKADLSNLATNLENTAY